MRQLEGSLTLRRTSVMIMFLQKKGLIPIRPHLIRIYVRIKIECGQNFYITIGMADFHWDQDLKRLDFLLRTRLEIQFQVTAYFEALDSIIFGVIKFSAFFAGDDSFLYTYT